MKRQVNSKPILFDFPEEIQSERLFLRSPRAGEGPVLHAAIVESLESLSPWMPWVHPVPTVEEEEENVREARIKFLSREDLRFHLYSKSTGEFVGGSGLHRIVWPVPKFEIGYWVRTKYQRQGFIKEAAAALTNFAFETLHARRVEIRVDDRNEHSWRIPERLGFTLEGILRNDARDVEGTLRDTRVYAKIRDESETSRT